MVFGSFLDCDESKNLEVIDMEEGEICDTSSLESIIEEDFNKMNNNNNDVKVNNNSDKVKSGGDGDSRVWAVKNMYSTYGGYASGLHNLAWAQGVQNKPLNDIFVMEIDKDVVDVNANSNNNISNNNDLDDDDDKEEGELEEGEIDVDDDTNCVRDVLKSITVAANVAESCAETCSRIQSALQSILFSGIAGSEKDDLVSLLFNAVEVVHSVFCSMNNSQKEENKDNILRLLSFLKNEHAHLFTPDHMKEIQVMITSIDSVDVLGNSDAIGKEEKLEALDKTQRIVGLKHDSDSLPSPTREAPSRVPVNELFSVGDGTDRFGLPPTVKTEAEKMELDGNDSKLHIHETDALKAASTDQQNCSRSAFFTDDKFLSPTPSPDCEGGAVDTKDEVSSASSLTSSKPAPLDQMPVSSTSINRSSMHVLINSRIDASGAGSYPVKTSAKSRDPRLRFNFSGQSSGTNNTPNMEYAEGVISRKRKNVEEPSLDATAPKRLGRSLENSEHNTREERTMAGKGGWPAENTVAGSQLIERNHLIQKGETELKRTLSTSSSNLTATSNGNEQAPITSSVAVAPLYALLNSKCVNPTMLLNKLLEIHQRLAEVEKRPIDSATSTLHLANSNSARGTDATVNTGPAMTAGVPQSYVEMLPASSPATSMAQTLQEDSGKIHMKPRDPRRSLLGSSAVQKSGSLGSERSKAIVSPTPNIQGTGDNVNAQKLDVKAETTNPPATQNVSSASVPFTSERAEQKSGVPNSQNLKYGVGSAASGSSRLQNTWAADVEHLFEGYDENQKAVIQRERARRLKEQNKMFAARKLCLVLDLDHTLLNSAKFSEVNPEHDEILRKKEKQDCEMPQRHLFRLRHMGMWTKLRPGVWNFLEKASKLFEMHIYTMGNKLYATEMAKLLDPKGELFAGRVISRGDDAETVDTKCKDLEGVLGLESSVVIIDDSVRVWPHNQPNLIAVERYIYFPCSRHQFGLSGLSLLEIDRDEIPGSGTLASSLGVIERIHQNFFASQSLKDADVRHILGLEQRKILHGCRIVFSGVVPVGDANPHRHPLWRTAEQFGASCTNQIDDEVTHVVAQSPGTDKVNWGISNRKFVVYPNWLEASTLLYRKANEQDFAIKTEKQPPNKQAHKY